MLKEPEKPEEITKRIRISLSKKRSSLHLINTLCPNSGLSDIQKASAYCFKRSLPGDLLDQIVRDIPTNERTELHIIPLGGEDKGKLYCTDHFVLLYRIMNWTTTNFSLWSIPLAEECLCELCKVSDGNTKDKKEDLVPF